MEWFFQIFDKFAQSFIWRHVLSHVKWVDWLTIFFVIAGLINGVKRGLLRGIVDFLEILGVLFVSFAFYKKLATLLHEGIKALPKTYANPVAFISLMLLVTFVIHLVDSPLGKLFHTKLAGPIRGVGGAVMGVLYILLLWGVISYGIWLIPVKKMQRAYEEGSSLTGYYVKQSVPTAYLAMTNPAKLFEKEEKKNAV